MDSFITFADRSAQQYNSDPGRGNVLGRALWLCNWLHHRRTPFTAAQLAIEMEASYRTALRWLEVAEGVGLVESDRSGPAWRWSRASESDRKRDV